MNKDFRLINRLFSEGADQLRGEWWIDDSGQATFADGDIGDYTHAMVAFGAALGVEEDPNAPEMIPMEPLSDEAMKWLREQGSDEGAIEYLKDGADPRDYALSELGWIRVANNNFQMMNFDDRALSNIKSFLGEELEDDSGNVGIEELTTGDLFDIPMKMMMHKGSSVEVIKRYSRGYGKKIVDSSELKGKKRWDPWASKFREEKILKILSTISDDIYPLVISGIISENKEPKKVIAVPLCVVPTGYKMFSEVREAVLIRRNNFDLIIQNERKLKDATDTYDLICCSSGGFRKMVIPESLFNQLWEHIIPRSVARKVRYNRGRHFIDQLDNAVLFVKM